MPRTVSATELESFLSMKKGGGRGVRKTSSYNCDCC